MSHALASDSGTVAMLAHPVTVMTRAHVSVLRHAAGVHEAAFTVETPSVAVGLASW